MRAANTATGYILVDAAGSPVPLPYHTPQGPTLRDFRGPNHPEAKGVVFWRTAEWPYIASAAPEAFNLRIITEAEYMEKQS